MNAFFDNIVENAKNIQWEGPAMFVVVILAIFAVFRQYHMLLLTLLVIALGWGAQDMMVMNFDTQRRIISLPLLIYSSGGGLVVILTLLSFFKSAIK